jgi:hypothetical protein
MLPLAWRLRSRVLFVVAVLGTSVAAGVAAGNETSEGSAVVATFLAAAAALLAWPLAFAPGGTGADLGRMARPLGMAGFAVLAYACSFHETAGEFAYGNLEGESTMWWLAAGPLLVAGAAFLVEGARREGVGALRSRNAATAAALAGVLLLLAAMAAPEETVLLAIAGNLALAAPAVAALLVSVRDLERGPFWGGVLVLVLLVVTRFLEFDTNLGIKAAVFTASGLAVILGGLAFEKRLRAREGHRGA